MQSPSGPWPFDPRRPQLQRVQPVRQHPAWLPLSITGLQQYAPSPCGFNTMTMHEPVYTGSVVHDRFYSTQTPAFHQPVPLLGSLLDRTLPTTPSLSRSPKKRARTESDTSNSASAVASDVGCNANDQTTSNLQQSSPGNSGNEQRKGDTGVRMHVANFTPGTPGKVCDRDEPANREKQPLLPAPDVSSKGGEDIMAKLLSNNALLRKQAEQSTMEKDQLKEKAAKYDELQMKLQSERKKHDEDCKFYTESLEMLEERMKELTKKNTQLTTRVGELESESTSGKGGEVGASSDDGTTQIGENQARQEVTTTTMTMTMATAQNSRGDEELKKEIEELKRSNLILENKIKRIQRNHDDLQEKKRISDQRALKAVERGNKIDVEKESLKDEVKILQNELQQVSRKEKKSTKLETELASERKRVGQISNEVLSMSNDMENLKQELQRLAKNEEMMKSERDALNFHVNSLNTENEILKKQVSECKEELEEMKSNSNTNGKPSGLEKLPVWLKSVRAIKEEMECLKDEVIKVRSESHNYIVDMGVSVLNATSAAITTLKEEKSNEKDETVKVKLQEAESQRDQYKKDLKMIRQKYMTQHRRVSGIQARSLNLERTCMIQTENEQQLHLDLDDVRSQNEIGRQQVQQLEQQLALFRRLFTQTMGVIADCQRNMQTYTDQLDPAERETARRVQTRFFTDFTQQLSSAHGTAVQGPKPKDK